MVLMESHSLIQPSSQQSARMAARRLSNAQLRLGLDTILAQWQETGCALFALPALLDLTHRFRAFAAEPDWQAVARGHAIAALLRQDPLTEAVSQRAHGYAAEAGLLDLVLDHAAARAQVAQASAIGLAVRLFTQGQESAVALRERRQVMAHAIDDTIRRVPDAAILALGCGHFRALEAALLAGEAGRILAADPRGECLALLRADHGGIEGLETLCMAPARFIARPHGHGRFDLIVVPALLEGMGAEAAARMVAALACLLRPGGRLLLGAMARGIRCDGYMDAFMGWQPVLRGEEEVAGLLEHAQGGDIARRLVFRGGNGAMLYGLVQRRG